MEKIDLRKLNASEKQQVRSQVVRLKKMGKTGKEIEEIVGVRQNRISGIWTSYQQQGASSLKPKITGRKNSGGMTLTEKESRKIRQVIISKAPNQLKMVGYLWTLAKISHHIEKNYCKNVSVRSVSNYMKRWGLTCQRPTKRAWERDVVRIVRFKKEEYPAIAARAKAENVVIYWGDETGVSNRENFERGFAKKGHPHNAAIMPVSIVMVATGLAMGGLAQIILAFEGIFYECIGHLRLSGANQQRQALQSEGKPVATTHSGIIL